MKASVSNPIQLVDAAAPGRGYRSIMTLIIELDFPIPVMG